MRFIVTGGAGFIGSAVVRHLIADTRHEVLTLDKLTYAGNLDNLATVADDPRYLFERADICDSSAIRRIFEDYRPDLVMHLAAESHVDRSIDGPGTFIETNVNGTFVLLEAARRHWTGLQGEAKARFRFHHVSTDEVFGSLGAEGLFHEDSPYQPNSPYSASKAASDHLARAWHHTYGLPTVASNCSNNYGPYHFPEKLIPLVILNALEGKPLPVYGTGANVRDWLYVEDHARALVEIATRGRRRRELQRRRLERATQHRRRRRGDLRPRRRDGTFEGHRRARRKLITFVTDRPGHDGRYAIDASKIKRELGWEPRETFESGLRKTVRWYLDNPAWWGRIRSGVYRGERLGAARDAS